MQSNVDVLIVGAGLSGLSLAILLAKQNKKVVLVEKKDWPQHKVCGEYVSLESWPFLEALGIPLSSFNLPIIKNLQITSLQNKILSTKLPLGGFGISRYLLDNELMKIAKQVGVQIFSNSVVDAIIQNEYGYKISIKENIFESKFVVGAYGKHSVPHFYNSKPVTQNFVGVKYHIQSHFSKDAIALHNFKGGYAGISAIENNLHCLCYMINSKYIKESGGIQAAELQILKQNKHLKSVMDGAVHCWEKPVTISNIYFGKRILQHHNILYSGDAAGAIPPLAGNGMSLAFRSANVLQSLLLQFFESKIDKSQLFKMYETQWNKEIGNTIKQGIMFQKMFGNPLVMNASIWALHLFKALHPAIIKQTHGKPFLPSSRI